MPNPESMTIKVKVEKMGEDEVQSLEENQQLYWSDLFRARYTKMTTINLSSMITIFKNYINKAQFRLTEHCSIIVQFICYLIDIVEAIEQLAGVFCFSFCFF